MKTILKIVLYLFLFFLVVVAVVLIYLKTALPDVGPAADLKIEYTKERIERGRYLATAVNVCMDCHSKRDWSKFSAPLVEGTFGMGGERFDESVGMPGVYYSKNITPEGISRYTDGELFRVITTGVSKEGKALFPLMPFGNYGRMDPEDTYSVIAFIRSLPPIKNEVPESHSNFPMNFIINTLPHKAQPGKRPDTTDLLAYGAYMTNATGCRECHTREKQGQIIEEFAFGGGREFKLLDGSTVRSSNITPDAESGIGNWTEEAFIQRFKLYTDSTVLASMPALGPGDFNSIMPWTMYARMTRKDLSAIYNYLKSIRPMSNKVVKFTPASK